MSGGSMTGKHDRARIEAILAPFGHLDPFEWCVYLDEIEGWILSVSTGFGLCRDMAGQLVVRSDLQKALDGLWLYLGSGEYVMPGPGVNVRGWAGSLGVLYNEVEA